MGRSFSCVADWYQHAIIGQAERLRADALCEGSCDTELLRVSALLAARSGHRQFQLNCASRVAQLDSRTGISFTDLGNAFERNGRHNEAVAAYLRALTLCSNSPEPYRQLGQLLSRQGHAVEAMACFQEAIRLRPNDAATYLECGDALRAHGRTSEALNHYQHSLWLEPHNVEAYCRLGNGQLAAHEWAAAALTFQAGRELDRDHKGLLLGLAKAMLKLGASDQAIAALRTVVGLAPTDVDACFHLTLALELSRRYDEAAEALLQFGLALNEHRSHSKAIAAFQQALTRHPHNPIALRSLGLAYQSLGEARKALPWFEAALAANSSSPDAHLELGRVMMTIGLCRRGWGEFRWHFPPQVVKRRGFEQPIWDGRPLNGKTLLVWGHHGLGDTIYFMRNISLPRARGAGCVIVECHQILLPLVERLSCVDESLAYGAPLPHFDVHVPLILLSCFVEGESIADQLTYLSVDDALVDAWRQRLGRRARMMIGLRWGGTDERVSRYSRDVPLATFCPLAHVGDARLISLQLGYQTIETIAPPPGLRVERLLEEGCSLVDTAALIRSLDLVITMDTMVAHLAGALGQPVWVLLQHACDWRWRNEGQRTSWYPSMRLFRQTRQGDWASVMASVRAELTSHTSLAAVL